MPTSDRTLPPNLDRPGRAAISNASGRFEPYARVHADDGWDIEEEHKLARTEITEERPRSALTRNSSPDLSFDRSINPYRGCEHGCIYCFARPTHAYLGHSPGLDFETKLVARPGIADVLRRELRGRAYAPAMIALGTNTDPYQPCEKTYRLMRDILSVLREHRHPVGIVTKGTLIERDIDLISEMAADGLANVGITVTTLDPRLSRLMEPRVPSPARRLKTIEKLANAGIPVRLMISPVIPALSDHELEGILAAGADAGARAATWIMLRLPREVSPLFKEWLAEHFPDRAARVMGRIREMHGGEEYSPQWHKRMRGEGSYAEMIAHRFKIAARRHGLNERLPDLRRDLFGIPGRGRQLDLF